ncbi:hypothetical protein ACF061_36895 [Streptomyces sp. NPDC015220]|uniref:hypothetical protein n=1 Tax=Streptomyces sp. NPDC015220 TaxID=3364947 RepID=UPI0037006004
MSGRIGRPGGRRAVAVLALAGGLLLGPVVPAAQAATVADDAWGLADSGPMPIAMGVVRELVVPFLGSDDSREHGKGEGKSEGKGEGKSEGKSEGKERAGKD